MKTAVRILCCLAAVCLVPALVAREMQLHVVDGQTGLPVPDVKIRAWVRTNLVTDAAGNCPLPLPKPESERFSYRLTLTKDGYVGRYVVWSESLNDKYEDIPLQYTAKLEKGVAIGGVVVDDAGRPLTGARVIVSAPPDDSPGRERSVTAPHYHVEHTDSEGRWHFDEAPRDFSKFMLLVEQPGYVTALFATDEETAKAAENAIILPPSDFLTGSAKMVLGHGIELSGRVIDAAGKPVPGATITRNHEWRNSAASLNSDADGRFTIINLRPGEIILTFQAQGFSAQTRLITLTNGLPELTVQMPPGRVLRGRVVDESGKPIANAVAQMDRVPLGPLEYDWSATTGADGRFIWDSAPDGPHPYYFTAGGFHPLSDAAMVADGEEKLIILRKERAGDQIVFSGTVRDETSRGPLPNFTLRVAEYHGSSVSNLQMSISNSNGSFALPVDSAATVCRIVVAAPGHIASDPENLSPDDGDQRLEFQLALGMTRLITGKFTVTNASEPIDWSAGATAVLSTVVPPPLITETNQEAARAAFDTFLTTDAGAVWQRAHRSYPVMIDSDGAFRIEDIPAGRFELDVNIRQPPGPGAELIAALKTQFTVEATPGDTGPMDMGPVAVPLKKSLKVADTAPEFLVKTVDGQPLRLADYRGKYVLLDFWATWCGPCVGEMPHLKATYQAFGSDPRFAMISLSLDDDASAPEQFARKNGLKWTQGFLGKWSDASAASAFGVEAIPAIFLIGPDGKIVEKNLRGDEIRAAVARALGVVR